MTLTPQEKAGFEIACAIRQHHGLRARWNQHGSYSSVVIGQEIDATGPLEPFARIDVTRYGPAYTSATPVAIRKTAEAIWDEWCDCNAAAAAAKEE